SSTRARSSTCARAARPSSPAERGVTSTGHACRCRNRGRDLDRADAFGVLRHLHAAAARAARSADRARSEPRALGAVEGVLAPAVGLLGGYRARLLRTARAGLAAADLDGRADHRLRAA